MVQHQQKNKPLINGEMKESDMETPYYKKAAKGSTRYL
jgi:hypothetical protein